MYRVSACLVALNLAAVAGVSEDSSCQQAVVAFRRADPKTAAYLANQCLAHGDNRPEMLKLLALSEYLLGQHDKFETHIRAVLAQNPRDVEAHYSLGRYFFEIGRYTDSLASLRTVMEIDPEHYKAHYYAGLLHGASGRPELARHEYLAAIKTIESKQIRYAWPFAEMGRQLVDAGDYGRGLEWLARAIQNDPANPKAQYEYGRALSKNSSGPEVEKALLEAIRLDSGYSDAYYLLARYYQRTGKPQMASELLTKFKKLKKDPVPSPYGLRR